MGVLWLGLPSPTAIPLDYCLCTLDLKDLFSPIPLHLKDREKFAFTLSSPSHQGPGHQFHWTVLTQVMANSPTMCQEFVAAAIELTCREYPGVYVLYYMDDILMSSQ
jgi:hypothetical protein